MDETWSRRSFLGAAGGAAAVGTMGPLSAVASGHDRKKHGHHDHGHGKGGDLPLSKIGIQLFTVRDLLADNELDLPGTFEMLRDAGYAEVEIGGTYDGRTAAQFRALAEQYGLEPEGMPRPGRRTTPGARTPRRCSTTRRRSGCATSASRRRPHGCSAATHEATRRSPRSSTRSGRRPARAG